MTEPTLDGGDTSTEVVENKPADLPTGKHKVKVNGVEKEYTIEDLKRLASISDSADSRFKSAKQMQTEAQQLKAAFDSGDIVGSLQKAGKSPKEIKTLLEDKLLDMIEQENLDPKDREIKELRAFKEAQEKAKREVEEANLTKKQEAEVERMRSRLENELVTAITDSNLPKTAVIFQRIAREMEVALNKGYELSAKEATRIVEQDVVDEYLSLLPTLGADRIKKALGKDVLNLLREEQVKSVKEAVPSFAKSNKQAAASSNDSDEDDKPMAMGSFFRNLNRK